MKAHVLKSISARGLLVVSLWLLGSSVLAPVSADSLVDAISNGKVSAQWCYRYEWVQQQAVAEKAGASTLRTHLAYNSGDYYGFNGFLQFEDVHVVGNERYNSTINGLAQYPVVADPAGTEVNQAFIVYQGLTGVVFKYGRQNITYDNQRFIGNVGWRQNTQTFDALSLVYSALPDITLSYAHVTNANRIFGESHPTLSDVALKGEWLNLAYQGLKAGKLVGYGYFLDFDPAQPFAITQSQQSLGLRFDGGTPLGQTKLLYTLEYAKQGDYKDGAASIDADYSALSLGAEISAGQLRLSQEQLSGDGVYAFQTPFATLHAFNGWADKFLTTPVDGLIDRFVTLSTKLADINFTAVYHIYSSDNLDYDYGSELNLSVGKKFTQNWSGLLKFADYQGDPNATNSASNPALAQDIRKAWVQVELEI